MREKIRIVSVAMALMLLCSNSAFEANQEQRVEWDALEVGKLYMIQETVALEHYRHVVGAKDHS